MALKAISATRLFDGIQYYENAAMVWEGSHIHSIVPIESLTEDIEHQHFDGALIAPGFIDLQVNGGGDVMFNNDMTLAGIDSICRAHRTHGTAYLLPTLISATPEHINRALDAIQSAIENQVSGVLGIHLEGPWLNPEKKGAHNPDLFYSPTPEQLSQFHWPTKGKVLVTVAAENLSIDSLKWLKDHHVTLSCGHSNATTAQLTTEKLALIDGFTHL
ncbi:N-acetylglucosamine-6-phosphate deacetylase, partial [Vibrio cholerae]|nr:N-acetylglucosamine-6-phosphate deacetylase [Vibrio cholerae]